MLVCIYMYKQSFAKLCYFAKKKQCRASRWWFSLSMRDMTRWDNGHGFATWVFFSFVQTGGNRSHRNLLDKIVKIHTCNFKSVCCDRSFLLCSEILVASFLQPNTLLSLMHVSWLQLKCWASIIFAKIGQILLCKSSPSRSTPCISGSARSVIQVLSS